MVQRIRTTLFYGAILAFLVLATLVAFFSFGYRIDFSSRRIIQTGTLTITTIPKGAQITIGDGLPDGRSPIRIPSILPGTYTVQINKPGYLPWQTTVQINPRRSTIIENALLFPVAQDIQPLWSGDNPLFSPSPNERFLAIVDIIENQSQLSLVDSSTGTQLDHISLGQVKIEEVSWSAANDRLIISSSLTNNDKDYRLFRFSGNKLVESELPTDFIPDALWWSGYVDDILFATDDSRVFEVDLFTRSYQEIFKGLAVDHVSFDGNEVFIIDSSQAYDLILYNPANQLYSTINTWPERPSFTANGNQLTVYAKSSCLLYLPSSGNTLKLNQKLDNCSIFFPHPTEPLALLSDSYDLRVFDYISKIEQTISRQNRPLTTPRWHTRGQVILVAQPDGLEAIDLSSEMPVRTMVLSRSSPKIVSVNHDGSILLSSSLDNQTVLELVSPWY